MTEPQPEASDAHAKPDARSKLAYLLSPPPPSPKKDAAPPVERTQASPPRSDASTEPDSDESEAAKLRRELREVRAQLAASERCAGALRESVLELRQRLAEHTEDLPPEPKEELQVALSNQPPPVVLGIKRSMCHGCKRAPGQTTRIDCEEGAIYCKQCWDSYYRCGWWRPAIRVSTLPPPPAVGGGLHYGVEDAFMLSGFVCDHDDLSLMESLKAGLPEGKDFGEWHGARHLGVQWQGEGGGCRHDGAQAHPAMRRVVEQLEKAFGVRAAASRLNLYRNNRDYKPLHHDRGRDDQGNGQVTVGVSFGACRELTLTHVKSGVNVSFPQRNGDVFAFTPELNDVFLHGVPRIGFGSPSLLEEPDKERMSLIIWGPRVAVDPPSQES